MSQYNPDHLLKCSSYEGDFRYEGVDYHTSWAKVLGPVGERRNYRNTYILVGMYSAANGDVMREEPGSPAWCAAMELSRTDTTWLTQVEDEFSPFTFRETLDTNSSAWVEADLVFKLGVWDANTWTQFPAPTFFENLVQIMKHYEWHRERKLRDTEAMDLTWGDCMKILSAIKAAKYKINKKRGADQRKGRFPPEGRADINLLHLEQYDELFNRVQKTARILEKRYKNEHN